MKVNDNTRKRILEMIKAGYNNPAIVKEVGCSLANVNTVFKNWLKANRSGKVFIPEEVKKPYFKTESEIYDSLNPRYSIDELKGDELKILNEL